MWTVWNKGGSDIGKSEASGCADHARASVLRLEPSVLGRSVQKKLTPLPADAAALRICRSIPAEMARFYLAEIVMAIDSVHRLGYVHRWALQGLKAAGIGESGP